jgi:hypothetical protein
MRAPLVALVALLILLAGCAGSNSTSTAAKDRPTSTLSVGEFVEGAGVIRGFVLDNEQIGIPSAPVGLVELHASLQTGPNGEFAFSNVPPGQHTLHTAPLGYEPALQKVTLEPGGEAYVELVLRPIRISVPYSEIVGPYQGYFECRLGTTIVVSTWTGNCGTVCQGNVGCVGLLPASTFFPNDKNSLTYNLTGDDPMTFVGEMKWLQGTYATSQSMRLSFSHVGRASSHWWCAAEGPSPLQYRFEVAENKCIGTNRGSTAGAVPNGNLTLLNYGGTPFGALTSPANLAFQQRFEMLSTNFYGVKAPEGYTGFAEA